MGEFFRGWRQKLGLLTLVMACMLMGGWMRNSARCDYLVVRCGQSNYIVGSVGNRFKLCHITPLIELATVHWESGKMTDTSGKHDIWEVHDVLWRRDLAGYLFGAGMLSDESMGTSRIEYFATSYFSITFPLTLISLWLLLYKP